jgi:hypothetical protein
MRLYFGAAFFAFVMAVGPSAVADNQPPTTAVVDKPRKVSPEGVEYLEKLRQRTPFGTVDFSLDQLRAGMGTRREPTIKDVRLVRVKVGEVPCEWVVAAGAERHDVTF